jgi:hypothetical protein
MELELTMPRPSKYTAEAVTRITDAIAVGATYQLAAQYGGISYETLRAWAIDKPAFSDALKEAEGRAVVRWLEKIEAAANDGVWQAAAWKLERRYPQAYGRRVHEVTGADAGPVKFTLTFGRGDADGAADGHNDA